MFAGLWHSNPNANRARTATPTPTPTLFPTVTPTPTPMLSGCSTETTLCLGEDRFLVVASWTKPDGESAPAHAVALTANSGYFWFLDANNVEVVVKALNGCSVNGHSWIFSAGFTDLAVAMTVTDTTTNQSKAYSNSQGTPFRTIADTTTFAACPAGAESMAVSDPEEPAEHAVVAPRAITATVASRLERGLCPKRHSPLLERAVPGRDDLADNLWEQRRRPRRELNVRVRLFLVLRPYQRRARGKGPGRLRNRQRPVVLCDRNDHGRCSVERHGYLHWRGEDLRQHAWRRLARECFRSHPRHRRVLLVPIQTITDRHDLRRRSECLRPRLPQQSQPGMEFLAAWVHVRAGDAWSWVWASGSHSITSGLPFAPDGTWDSGILLGPYTFSRTFPKAGTFTYYCQAGYDTYELICPSTRCPECVSESRNGTGVVIVDPVEACGAGHVSTLTACSASR